jgi:hypothetical protein
VTDHRRILELAERLEYRLTHPHSHPHVQARALGCTRNALRRWLLKYTGQHTPRVTDAELVQYARKVVSMKQNIQKDVRKRKPFCALASCAHHHPLKRLCTIGLRRTSGECPEYQPKRKEQVTLCHRQSCAYYYQDDWRKRCRLGRRMPKGECEYYAPKPNIGRKMKKVPTCSKSSCVHWYREKGRYRCRLGLSRRSGRDCPKYQPKKP